MTTEASPVPTPAWATPLGAGLLVLLLSLPRLLYAGGFGLIGDEAYYAIWSFHPGFGYYDHSPAVAWFIWAGRMLFGEGEWGVRSLFLLANLVTCAALYRIGTVLSGDRRIGAAAAIGYAVIPGVMITFSVATPDGPSTMFWVLTVWAIAEFGRGRNANWWLLAGAFAGLGLLSKYTVAFLGVGIAFYLLTSRERLGWLKLWQVWAAGVLAIGLFSPVIWINSQRHWNSFRFQLGRSTLEDPHFAGLGEFARFLVETSIQLLPTLFVFMLLGLGLFFLRRARGLALPVLTSVPMIAYFLVHALFGRVNPNWTAPLYPELALIGAWAAIAIRPRNWLRWPLDILYVLHVPTGLAVSLTVVGIIVTRSVPFVGPLPVVNYLYGWPDLQHQVSVLARDNDAQWVDTIDYAITGGLGYYGLMAKDPLPVYQTNQPFRYAYAPPMPAGLRKARHLLVRKAGRETAPEGMSLLTTIKRSSGGQTLDRYQVFISR